MNASDTSRPTLIVIAGPNGSGKTSLTRKALQHEWLRDCVYINADDIAIEKFGGHGDAASLAAAEHAAAMREGLLCNAESMAFETVFSAPDKLDFLRRAKTAGHFIRLFFVATDSPTINAARVAQRMMEGGHEVPINKIISRYAGSIANCVAAASFVDRAYIYDNSVDRKDPRLLFRTENGYLERYYKDQSTNEWAQPIVAVLDIGRIEALKPELPEP